MQDFVKSYKANPGLIPIVEVDEVDYESKAKGARGARKHAPVFKIIAWASEAELAAGQEGSADDYDRDDVAALPEPEVEAEVAETKAPARPARTARAAPVETPAAEAPKPAAASRRGRF